MNLAARSLSVLCLLVLAVEFQWPLRSLPPRLVDQCDADTDRNSAPVVIVGVIRYDRMVLRPVLMHRDRRTPLQMRRMSVAVENVLRGDIPAQEVDIYYFTWAGGFNGPQPLGMWRAGSRRIFWLRRDAGVLRTVCDGWDRCTWGVYSGSHASVKRSPDEDIHRAVADISLTRGEGSVNEARFAGAIQRGTPVPPEYEVEYDRQLAITERGGVRTAACEQLWIWWHEPNLRSAASAAIEQARCVCREGARGEPDCGPKAHGYDDPPY